jgi:transposase
MVAVGVDSHKDTHVAVALSGLGELRGELTITANLGGYAELVGWLRCLAEEVVVGIEGAGSWGAGLCEYLQGEGFLVFEVERPRRSERRAGKSDSLDALTAAKRVLAGEGLARPRARGARTAIAALLVAYRSCVGERTRLLNQLQALHTTAPLVLRQRIGEGNGKQLERRIIAMRARPQSPSEERVVFSVLRDLARRSSALAVEARRYTGELEALIATLAPTLLTEPGVGPISAAKLIACDPARFKHEAAFARCNGTAPLPASSGKTIRHRLSRGGDRQANNAIHTIALSRSIHHPETRAYLDRRINEGKTSREAMRALKRHLSRRLFKLLTTVPLTT